MTSLIGKSLCLEGSGKNKNIGKEKIVHQIATETNDNLIATVASGIPNDCGYKYISTFTINNSPPPRYPSEYPRDDT